MVRKLILVLVVVVASIVGCGGAVHAPSSGAGPTIDTPRLRTMPQPGVSYIGVIGDAYSVGSRSLGTDRDAWPALAAEQLRNQGVHIKPSIAASPTSGYVHHGAGSRFFFDLVGRVVGKNQKLVILFGSARDITVLPNGDKLAQWVKSTLEAVKKAAPSARILVIGPAVVQYEPAAEVLQVRDIIRGQAEAGGAAFVDPLAERWFADSPDLVRMQGDRPNAAGQEFIAARIAPLIAEQLRTSAS